MSPVRSSATTRLPRLLALLQWAAGHPDGVPVTDVCARFRLRPEQLAQELDLASMVGADSARYDDMPFEIFVEDGRLYVRLFNFRRPMRLTPEEGLALVAAADVLVDEADPAHPLSRALAKLGTMLGIEVGEAVDVDLQPGGGPTGALLTDAIHRRRQVRFSYWTYGRDVVAERTVDPWRVFSVGGAWYLSGRAHDAEAERRFRLDRMEDVAVLDAPMPNPPARVATTLDLGAAPRVVLDLAGPARWVADAHPVVAVEDGPGDQLRVTLAVAGASWLERLLLQLGTDATVVAIDAEVGDRSIRATAAARVLARYRDEGPSEANR